MDTPLPTSAVCNTCGYQIDTATGMTSESGPTPGDVSICLACGSIEVFIDSPVGLVTRRTTEAEYHECMADEAVQTIVSSIMLGKSVEPTWPEGSKR